MPPSLTNTNRRLMYQPLQIRRSPSVDSKTRTVHPSANTISAGHQLGFTKRSSHHESHRHAEAVPPAKPRSRTVVSLSMVVCTKIHKTTNQQISFNAITHFPAEFVQLRYAFSFDYIY
ncbi:unnamed protein product [Vicia faba]|uniref:Uncharacterized protein n=1 Tax=Vicia faba TaxID=3906 RepID=A0AAV1A7V1_VICFA|nr:unnamed protein product [Vicia faba]